MGSFSLWHWLVVLLIVVLIFGTKRLRNIGTDLGGALRDFRKGLNEAENPAQSPSKIESATSETVSTSSQNQHESTK